MKHLVLVGGGHSHVIVLRMLGMNPIPDLSITLISPDVRSAYSGMLPGVVAGHYTDDDIHIDLVPLCRFAGARFIEARVDDIDTTANVVRLPGRPAINYDIVSLDIGITPDLTEITGAAEEGVAVKPINDFLAKWHRIESDESLKQIGVVGGGAGGVELCLAIHHRLTKLLGRTDVEMHLFVDGGEILPEFPESMREMFDEHLKEKRVRCHTDFRAISLENGTLMSAGGQQCELDKVFFVTQAAPQCWLSGTGLALDDRGFVSVKDTLQSVSHGNVFAVGDVAHMTSDPRPKAGVFAVRQGPALFRNIDRLARGKSPRPYKPQKEFLALITTGPKHAVATRNGLATQGWWVWQWKDWIDRRFMNRFNDLPDMDGDETEMYCGGCGAKVGARLLRDVLTELGVAQDQQDDAAVTAISKENSGAVLLQTVDAFRAFIDDPYVFAKIAVEHALSDIYAMGGTPRHALAIVTVPYLPEDKTRTLLLELMSGALEVLGANNVELVGGHTSEGPELSLGFSVSGVGDTDKLLHKKGVREGDVLILTKPLGTGAVFAADMRHRAKGAWIRAAVAQMLTSNRDAARIFSVNGAHACTDITGFGLAGHLQEMLTGSGLGARLDLDALPVLAGTREVMAAGIVSTLHESNRRSADHARFGGQSIAEILFDPQTAGGLLAAVPASDADAMITALCEAGYESASNIGTIVSDGFETIAPQ